VFSVMNVLISFVTHLKPPLIAFQCYRVCRVSCWKRNYAGPAPCNPAEGPVSPIEGCKVMPGLTLFHSGNGINYDQIDGVRKCCAR
jgi:hypothetical protein